MNPAKHLSALIFAVLYASISPQNADAQVDTPVASLADFCSKLPRPQWSALKRLDIPAELTQDWFEVYDVTEGVIAIYEPFQWQEVISYLILGSEKALLFDTGNGLGDIELLVRSLTDKPIAVLNSHTHYDHVGGNFSFDVIYGMDTNYTRKNQQGVSNSEIGIEASGQALCRDIPGDMTQETHVGQPFKITEFIDDGTVIDLGDRQLEVLSIPGHTPDAIALVDRNNGLMWTGDTYYSGPIWLYVPETDLEAYALSLERLITEATNMRALLPAHNTTWVDASVLHRVKAGFQIMLKGGARKVELGDGMAEYFVPAEDMFSFLMRDEPLPYTK